MNDDEKLLRLAKALIVKATQHNDASLLRIGDNVRREMELAVSIALYEVAQELINIASNENPSR